MRRKFIFSFLTFAMTLVFLGPVSAQEDAGIQPAFSNHILSSLGYPTLTIEATDSGFNVPSVIESGYILVTIDSLPDSASYVNFMQPAQGLSIDEATELALQTGRDDIAHENWVYAGGSYAMSGQSVSFVVDLQPGEWQVAASHQIGDSDEIMTLYPLTVTESDRADSSPETEFRIGLNDTEFQLSSDTFSSGPQVYEITNVGEASRQLVLLKSPRELTLEDYQGFFASFETGTPGPEIMSQLVWVGYAAILSPGQTMWLELDLTPGIYTPTSWVVDPETGAPALLLGMLANFEVIA